jgi:hypothetical protein
MSQSTMLSRRKALQFLTGAPLLPLGSAVSATSLLTACGGGDDGLAQQQVAQFLRLLLQRRRGLAGEQGTGPLRRLARPAWKCSTAPT